MDKRTLVFGIKRFGRTETVKWAVDHFQWRNLSIGISQRFGLIAWLTGRASQRRVIYYCIDFYSPWIADNRLDSLFIWISMQIDKWLIKHCDDVWDISKRINEGRLQFGNYKALSQIVPMAYPPDYFKSKKGSKRCIFVGLKPYGMEEMPDDILWIKGDMPLELMLETIAGCGIGIAIWSGLGNHYYGDPGKTKLYLACGIPVITTDNTVAANLIKETDCGIIVKYNSIEIDWAIRFILTNYKHYKENVKRTWKYINAEEVYRDIQILE